MSDGPPVDNLERYLATCEITQGYGHSMGGGGHAGTFVIVLAGGVGALAKPGTTEDTRRMMNREAAAWRLARAFGWTDLVSVTTVRDVPVPGGGSARASIQVLWPANDVGGPAGRFRP